MKKTKLLAGAVVAVIGGLAMTSVVSARAPVTVDSINGDIKVCGTEYISDSNGAQGCITIQGKNVGAQKTGAGPYAPSTSYGDYFQWGDSTGHTQADWNRNNVQSDNAWGGESDNYQLVYPIEHESNRKGPCDEGYHVPSRGEIYALMDMWAESGTNGYIDSNNISQFYTDFQMPFAGRRYSSDGSLMLEGSNAAWWSSTPDVGDAAWILGVNKYSANAYDFASALRTNGYSVRCFKNSEPKYIELTDTNTQVTVGQTVYNELLNTMTVTINNEVNVEEDKPVVGEVSVSFGSNESAKFSKLVKVNVPVEDANRVIIKVKHAGSEEYNFDGLTKNKYANCDANGRPASSQYNGEAITVVNGFATIYTCEASSFIAIGEGPLSAQIVLSVNKGELTIGTETGNLNLGQVNVSNSSQELSGSFGADSFWVEDMKGVESGYYTTISVTDLTGSVASHVIPANNISLKTAGNTPTNISGATASEAKVIFGEGITSWHSGSTPVNYFQRLNTATADAGRVGKWGDNLQIKVNIPAHTPSDTYRGTITYTLYDNDL